MEDPEKWYKPINELAAQGLLAPDAVLNKLTKKIPKWHVLHKDTELPYLRRTFDSLATEENGIKRLTKSAFLSFLENSGYLPPSMRETGVLVFRSLLHLSQYPFYRSIPGALIYEELMRALAWTMSHRSRLIYDEGNDSRSRSPADYRRQLFQSFATTRDGKTIPFDPENAKKQAEQRAFDYTTAGRHHTRRFAKTNYDDDGDEMFHDILDLLYAVQPKEIGWKAPPRHFFRPIARGLVGDERVHDLSIPQDEFRALVKLMLLTYFGKPRAAVEEMSDLDHVVDCIVRPVVQRPDMGITWDMFEQAATTGMPELMRGLERFLSPFYTDDEDIGGIDFSQPGKVATWPVLAQMGSLDIFGTAFIYVQRHKYYDIRTAPLTASTLADELDALSKAGIAVLFSGKNSQTGEKNVFGYYMPYYEFELSPFLFQLCHIPDSFRGDAPKPGRGLDEGELVFGQRGNGVSFVLQQDSKKVTVSHHVFGQHEPMYAATTWRGDWQVEVEIEEIEIWIAQPPEDDDEEE